MKKINIVLLFLASISSAQSSFKNSTADSGLEKLKTNTVVFLDYNQDSKADVIVSGKLFQNITENNKIAFKDISTFVGLSELKGNPLALDFNNDHRIDILTTEGQLFYQTISGQFQDKSYLLKNWPERVYTISAADGDGDGDLDIVLGLAENHVNDTFTYRAPHIYINQNGGESYSDQSAKYGFDKMSEYVRGFSWADYDNDQKPDLYFSNYRLRANIFLKNDGISLTDIAKKNTTAGLYRPGTILDPVLNQKFGFQYGHTLGSTWADLNNDGNFDLWVSKLAHKFVGGEPSSYDYRGYLCDDSKIYKNNGAPNFNFTDMRAISGIPLRPTGNWSVYKGDELWSHSTAADYDNDGLIDMYVPQIYNLDYAYSLLYKNKSNFKFVDVSDDEKIRIYDSYAGAWADLDNDGRMDLLVSGRKDIQSEAEIQIYQNQNSEKNNFIQFELKSKTMGLTPIGTQVRLTLPNGETMVRQIEGSTGGMNQQNDPKIHFGLGKNNLVKTIQILWTNGHVQNISGLVINKNNIINED
jgi:enediyne biosynthesis protein E4